MQERQDEATRLAVDGRGVKKDEGEESRTKEIPG